MVKNMSKRKVALSLLLAFSMCLGVLAPAFAALTAPVFKASALELNIEAVHEAEALIDGAPEASDVSACSAWFTDVKAWADENGQAEIAKDAQEGLSYCTADAEANSRQNYKTTILSQMRAWVAENRIDASDVQGLIDALPEAETITEETKQAAEEALAQVDTAMAELSKEEAAKLNMEKYDAVKAKIEELDVAAVQALINALPEAEAVTAENREETVQAIAAIDAAFAELSESGKGKVDKTKYDAVMDVLHAMNAADVQGLIDKLPEAEAVTDDMLEDLEKAFAEIDAAYEALTDEEKALVDTTKYDAVKEAVENIYASFLEKASFVELQGVIDSGVSLMLEEDTRIGYEAGVVTLFVDILSEEGENSITIPAGKEITIDLNGHTINRNPGYTLKDGSVVDGNGIVAGHIQDGSAIVVEEGGSLTVKDSGETAGVITGAFTENGAAITNGGTFTLESGVVSGNKGGLANAGEASLNGGSITGNEASVGGGVFNTGSLTIAGASIEGNKAEDGAGLYNRGSVTMTDGTITGNEASDEAGGVYNEDVFQMTSGTISGNTAGRLADDLYSVTIQEAKISLAKDSYWSWDSPEARKADVKQYVVGQDVKDLASLINQGDYANQAVLHYEGVNPNPDEPGTEDPDKPGTEDPDKPGTEDPDKPGTEDPDKPGTEDPETKTYNVTYVFQGLPEAVKAPEAADYKEGAEVTIDVTYKEGDELTVDDVVYVFSGWKASGISVADGKFSMPAHDVTITGVWEKKEAEEPVEKTYTVTYVFQGLPESVKAPEAAEHKEGAEVTLNTSYKLGDEMTVDGKVYIFSGWSVSGASAADGKFIMPGRDVTVTGIWTEKAEETEYKKLTDISCELDKFFVDGKETAISDSLYVAKDAVLTLRYKITVKGEEGAAYVISSPDGTLVKGSNWEGIIGANGEASILVDRVIKLKELDLSKTSSLRIANTAFVKAGANTLPIDSADGNDGHASNKVETRIVLDNTYTVTIKYVDTDGKELKDAVTVKTDQAGKFDASDKKAKIEGYTYKTATRELSGTVTADTTITLTYTKNSEAVTTYTITVKYVDTKGNEIKSARTEKTDEDGKYDVNDQKIAISGYTYKSADKDLSGKTDKDITITLTYEKKAEETKKTDDSKKKLEEKDDTSEVVKTGEVIMIPVIIGAAVIAGVSAVLYVRSRKAKGE